MEVEEVAIAGDDGIGSTMNGNLQELVVARVAARADGSGRMNLLSRQTHIC